MIDFEEFYISKTTKPDLHLHLNKTPKPKNSKIAFTPNAFSQSRIFFATPITIHNCKKTIKNSRIFIQLENKSIKNEGQPEI